MPLRSSMFRKAVLAGTLVTGAGLASAGIAAAAGAGTSSTNSAGNSNLAASTSNGSGSTNAPPDPATMTHGPNETLLTGTDLQKADAAAQAAVPGATIIRAETDSSGAAPYEVHMKKTDGTYVTVQLDSNFNVVKTVSGFGAGPAGGQAPNGTPPNGSAPPNGATSPPSGSTSSSTAA
ncbi:MAG TPA: hypothetical protein VMO88_14960 [Acidimicrobiales bacterium]|nr:hypothetical protein [Acidimicrobiales bacterium]